MPLTAPPEAQALLLDLQALDSKLQQLAQRESALPEARDVTALEAERESLRATLAEQTGAWEDGQAELGRVESDVEVVEARIARDSERLQASSSTKDVAALEQELEALARRKSDLEDIELAVMESVEHRETELGATQTALAELEERIGQAVVARDTAFGHLREDARRATADRAALVERIPHDLLELYERQRARYGLGASLLRGGVSTGSGMTLTPTDLAEIRAAAPDAVILCPESSAILVRTAESGL
ncbi:MAG: hypothetical protein J0G30_11295 [Actinomycetales bacterium]|nr:hypothetical protein [Actinomycetales bacterium]